jgi:citrate lyase beta subunit
MAAARGGHHIEPNATSPALIRRVPSAVTSSIAPSTSRPLNTPRCWRSPIVAVTSVDGVHLDLADDQGFVAECRQGRALGFDGKTLIHPKTIAAANEVFAPSREEVAWSRRIILAHSEAVAIGKGLLLVDGKLIENLHVENAHRVVALADGISELERGSTP